MKFRQAGRTLGCAAALFALNAYLTLRLFRIEYTVHMGSIEGVYIGLARYASQHWRDMGWFPLWYGGIPYADTYPPLLHWICALVINLTGVSAGLAHHFVTALAYSLAPVALFWTAWRLCGSRACAFAAGVSYSLVSLTCLLVKQWRPPTGGYFAPHRLEVLLHFGEGPHITSVCLVALAIGMVHVALEQRRPWCWLAAVLAVASVPMTNWLGGMALAMAMAAYLFAGLPIKHKPISVWVRMGAAGLYAYALVVPWLSPATIGVIRANAPRIARDYKFQGANRLLTCGVALLFLLAAWIMARWRVPRHIRFALLFLLITAPVVLGDYWFGLSAAPQAGRYQMEMDMAFSLAAPFAVWPLIARLSRRAAVALALAAILICVPIVKLQRHAARQLEQPIDIRQTIEYQAARWLDRNLPGGRVFAQGSIGFWLNAFSDSPQIGGGFDNGIVNGLLPDVIFQIFVGEQRQVAVDYIRALGVDALVAGGKDSAEYYHPIMHPERFAGLAELWRNGGDVIYAIPHSSGSLAHVMQPGDLVRSVPAAYSSAALQPYLAALDNPAYPAAEFHWRAPSEASVTANMRPGQILSVQITWDDGWNASVSGRPVHLWGDKLGQLVVEPRCDGPCPIDLKYDGGAEGRWARIIQRLAIGAGLLWLLAGLWRTVPRRSRAKAT